MWFLYRNRSGAATRADPRDRVFALLGLLKDKTFLEADYGRSVEEVYTDLAMLSWALAMPHSCVCLDRSLISHRD